MLKDNSNQNYFVKMIKKRNKYVLKKLLLKQMTFKTNFAGFEK
jgi:hypothetical protein